MNFKMNFEWRGGYGWRENLSVANTSIFSLGYARLSGKRNQREMNNVFNILENDITFIEET